MKFDKKCLQVYLVGGSQDVNNDVAAYLNKVELALQNGVTAFQYREKGNSTLSPKERIELGLKLRELCTKYAVPLVVNDDYQLAQQINADGVHVGQDDTDIEKVSTAVGRQMFIGYSCNNAQEIEHANLLDFIDYVGCGPVFPTTSKQDASPAIGLDKLTELNAKSEHPLVAIGGINESNLQAVHDTGVAGIAVISMVFNSDDLVATINKIKALY